ncbi:MAG: hypothetical protein HY064_12850 [Bacteroidetes bacterium]|nr:hypothetical protein [Bacteroidota bacterium]
MMIRFSWLLFFVAASEILLAQKDSAIYNSDFKFKPGLYLNFYQFRNNAPVPRAKIVSDIDSTRIDFIRQVTSGKMLTYLDSAGNLTELYPAKLWGFCENNSIYIHYNNDFFRIVVIGSLCHFTATYTTYMTTGPTMGGPTYSTPVQSMQQYVLDMQNGYVYDFILVNVEPLYQRDPVLYKEFMTMGKAKRRKMMFYYLRKYNDAHPLYFKK